MTTSVNYSDIKNGNTEVTQDQVATEVLNLISEIGRIPKNILTEESRLNEEMGFDSLMFLEFKSRITEVFPNLKDLPLSLLFMSTTVQEIIDSVSSYFKESSSASVNQKSSLFNYSIAYLRFQVWESKFQQDTIIRVDKHLVHKEKEQNVLLSRFEKLQNDVIIGEVVQDNFHPFFYEHPKDHVPGLYIIEATRQFGTALTHLYYDVSLDTSFILDELQARFYKFAETNLPLFLVAKIREKVHAKDKLIQMYNDTSVIQAGEIIAEINGLFKIFDQSKYNNVRNKVSVKKLV